MIAACYASYHGVTVYLLMADIPVALLFLAAIFAAGIGLGLVARKDRFGLAGAAGPCRGDHRPT